MELTEYHAKYLAHELTKRCASDSVEKLASVLDEINQRIEKLIEEDSILTIGWRLL